MMTAVTRVASSYVHLLYDYLLASGVNARALLGDPPGPDDHFVALPIWQAMLQKVDGLQRLPALGLRIAGAIRPHHFGVIGYAALACPTLAEALQRLERYQVSVYDVNPAQVSYLDDGDVAVQWGVARGKPGALVDETAVGALVHLARDMTGSHWPVKAVSFVNPKPADLCPYHAFFGGEVAFEAPQTRVVFEARYLSLPLRKSDPALLALLDQQADALLARVASVPAAVEAWRRTLVGLIREGRPSLSDLAAAHHLSARTLQRHLAAEGYSFQLLLDDTRRHLADAYLRDPGLELAEIALLLGFSEQSAFTRAFRQWTGLAPTQWRRQVNHE